MYEETTRREAILLQALVIQSKVYREMTHHFLREVEGGVIDRFSNDQRAFYELLIHPQVGDLVIETSTPDIACGRRDRIGTLTRVFVKPDDGPEEELEVSPHLTREHVFYEIANLWGEAHVWTNCTVLRLFTSEEDITSMLSQAIRRGLWRPSGAALPKSKVRIKHER